MNEGRCTDCKKRDVPVFQFSDGATCRECYLLFFGEARSFDEIALGMRGADRYVAPIRWVTKEQYIAEST